VFPDEGDIERFLGPNQPRPSMYAAQENLQLVAPSSSCPVKNRFIKKEFGGYNSVSGEFVLNSAKARFQFPRAVASPVPVEASTGNSAASPRSVEMHAGDVIAQNLLLHLLGAMKRSFYASRARSLPTLILPDEYGSFPRLRNFTKFNISRVNGK